MITQQYNLNLIPDTVPVSVGVSQYDKTSRTITFSVYNGDVLFDIPTGASAFVRGTKPDKTGFEYACTISGSDISFDIEEQMTVLAGRFPVELRIIHSGEILGTANFMLNVEPSPLTDDTIISDTDMPLIQEASAAADRAEAAASQASSVLATAVKKVNNILPDGSGNVQLDFGTVKSVNNELPDASGNVEIQALPTGGTIGQVLTKQSSTDGDADWETPSTDASTLEGSTKAEIISEAQTGLQTELYTYTYDCGNVTIPSNNFYHITGATVPTGYTPISGVCSTWSSNTDVFAVGFSGRNVYIFGKSGVVINGLNIRITCIKN